MANHDGEPITIATLITLLRNVDPKATVRFDFPPYQFPTEVASWRGSYDQPALGHAGKGSYNESSVNMRGRDDKRPTVAALIAELEKATDGREYEGWKGGDYSFSRDQVLRVDSRGEYNQTAITGIYDAGSEIILCTRWCDYA